MHGPDHPDHYDLYYAEKIWAMIPEVYRTEDGLGQQQGVLRGIVEVIATQAAETRRSIDRLWEDQHIETCDDWAVPYIGDLVGTRLLSEADPRARRVDVAQTVRFRRRRGTPALLEELVRELSGWDVLLVEAFRRLGRTPHRLDDFPAPLGRVTRTPAGGTANLANPRSAELTGTAFDEFFRTPDPRVLAGRDGRINLGNINFHLFRLIGFETPGALAAGVDSVNGVTPGRLTGVTPSTFTVDPSGRDVPLFSRGELVSPDTGSSCTSATEWQVTREIPCRLLSEAAFVVSPTDAAQAVLDATAEIGGALPGQLSTAFRSLTGFRFRNEARLRQRLLDFGVTGIDPQNDWYRSLLRSSVAPDSGKPNLYDRSIKIDLLPLDPNGALRFDEVMGADLSTSGCLPVPADPGVKLLIDPALGRFAFPSAVDPEPIVLRYFYGFSGPVGAGTYPRTLTAPVAGEISGGEPAPIVLPETGTLTIEDSLTYDIDLTADISDVILQVRGGHRPYLRIVGDEAILTALPEASPAAPAKFLLDGAWLSREELGESEGTTPEYFDIVIAPAAASDGDFDWEEIRIHHATLDPGGERADGKHLLSLRIVVRARVRLLEISQSMVGPIIVDTENGGLVETLEIVDSVVDAHVVAADDSPPDGLPRVAISNPQGDVRFEGITVFGDIQAERLLGSDSVVMGRLIVADSQSSCFRFGAALPTDPPGENRQTPDLFQASLIEIFPHYFISRRFGDPGYAQLSTSSPEELRRGAEDGSEMGAFSAQRREIRFNNVLAKVDEFKPVGILAQYVFEGEAAIPLPPAAAE